jgi:ribosome modulation factor
MSIRARLVFDVDDARRMITVKYFGDLDSKTIAETLAAQFQALEQPWLYDSLFDMRRFEGVVVLDDLAQMARAWNQAARGRDAGRLTAIVSADPLTHARQKAYEAGLPLRIVRTFNALTEATQWLEAMRNATDPKLAS